MKIGLLAKHMVLGFSASFVADKLSYISDPRSLINQTVVFECEATVFMCFVMSRGEELWNIKVQRNRSN